VLRSTAVDLRYGVPKGAIVGSILWSRYNSSAVVVVGCLGVYGDVSELSHEDIST